MSERETCSECGEELRAWCGAEGRLCNNCHELLLEDTDALVDLEGRLHAALRAVDGGGVDR